MSRSSSALLGRPTPPPRKLDFNFELKQRFLHESLLEEYEYEYFSHYDQLLSKTIPDPQMIDQQPEINWPMRPYLLDFLVESHQSFRLHAPTLFLAINIVDRYCSKRVVFKKHYQLVGCTALWLAAKYEDKKSRVPTLKELKLMCGNVYDEEMFVQMEGHILNTLDWSIGHPTLENFLYFKLIEMEELVSLTDLSPLKTNSKYKDILRFPFIFEMFKFIAEFSQYHREFLDIPPLILSESIALLTRLILINTIFGLSWKSYDVLIENMNQSIDKEISNVLNLLIDKLSKDLISKSLIKKYNKISGIYVSISSLVLKFIKFLNTPEEIDLLQQSLNTVSSPALTSNSTPNTPEPESMHENSLSSIPSPSTSSSVYSPASSYVTKDGNLSVLVPSRSQHFTSPPCTPDSIYLNHNKQSMKQTNRNASNTSNLSSYSNASNISISSSISTTSTNTSVYESDIDDHDDKHESQSQSQSQSQSHVSKDSNSSNSTAICSSKYSSNMNTSINYTTSNRGDSIMTDIGNYKAYCDIVE